MSSLPVEATSVGYVQRRAWRHLDRLHEEVLELDSPFAETAATGTAVLSVVIVGDQNAGKSTFLHAFAATDDPSFMELQSLFPTIASNFLNSRFLPVTPGGEAQAMDEPPFLDTDLARATLVLTVDDFAFFADERGLDPELVSSLVGPNERYVAVQLIELGGDHLDQMMDPALCSTATARDLAARSSHLLRNARALVYFANGRDLSAQPLRQKDRILARLRFLASSCPRASNILFVLTRSAYAETHIDARIQNLLDELPAYLAEDIDLARLASTCHVRLVNHLAADGRLDAEAVVRTLAECCNAAPVETAQAAATNKGPVVLQAAARAMMAAFCDVSARLDDRQFCPWLDLAAFREYLDHADHHGSLELPATLLIQHFASSVQTLVGAGLGFVRAGADSGIGTGIPGWEFKLSSPGRGAARNTHLFFSPRVSAFEAASPAASPAFRFPFFAPLLEALAFYLQHEVPAQLWLVASASPLLASGNDGALRARLAPILIQLETAVADAWQKVLASQLGAPDLQLWAWLAEELYLVSQLLGHEPFALECIGEDDLVERLPAALATVLGLSAIPEAPSGGKPLHITLEAL
jgi:hypothetical protein